MKTERPITPPPELVRELIEGTPLATGVAREMHLITAAFQAGADQELEACCECINDLAHGADAILVDLRAARRPKPPSLKEQALKALKNIDDACESEGFSRSDDTDIIRRALESIPD